jgi:hypothetical protein
MSERDDELVAVMAQALARAMLAPEDSPKRDLQTRLRQEAYSEHCLIAADPGVAAVAGRIAALGAPYPEILADLRELLGDEAV